MNYASHQIYPYFFLLRIRKKIDRISAKISAAITAYQIPYGPNRIGSTRTQITSKISVLPKEIIAEVNPSFSAVKNDEA